MKLLSEKLAKTSPQDYEEWIEECELARIKSQMQD